VHVAAVHTSEELLFCCVLHFAHGDIYTSTNSGVRWTDQNAAGSRNWFSITSSSDGTKLAAAVQGGDIFTTKAAVNTIGHSDTNFLSNGLVGYWTFDGPSVHWNTNTVDDKSGQGNTGTLVNMSTSSSPALGQIGQALWFNGTARYIDVGTSDAFLQEDQPQTISAWIYPQSAAFAYIAQRSGGAESGTVQFKCSCSNNNYAIDFRVSTFNGFEERVSSFGTISPNKWQHVAVTWDGTVASHMHLYVNGQETTYDSTIANGGHHFDNSGAATLIGGNQFSSNSTIMDDVRIYNRALSASEIKLLYSSGR
jgi:hypothetical protein